MSQSPEKVSAIKTFSRFVSRGKTDFYKKYRMDFVMGRREGIFLWDHDGEKYLYNLHCNGGVFNLGHRNPEIIEELLSALEEVDIGNHHLISRHRAELASRIAHTMPDDLEVTVFGVSGGEAVDLAIKTARAHTGRKGIVSITGGYHGHTGLALSTGDDEFIQPFGGRLPDFSQVPFGDLDTLEQAITSDTAAVILETVPATLGIVIPEKDYLTGVRNICTQNDVVMILDEVQAGLGRTGKLWAFEHYNIVPDIVVLGKGLSGGIYPITATVLRKPLAKVFEKNPFIHVSTFGGSEPGCRVAQKVLEITNDPNFLLHVNEMGVYFRERLESLLKKYPAFFKEIRQLGLMMGLVFRDELSGPVMTKSAYDHGILMVYANNDPAVCQFLPPLIVSKEQADEIMIRLDKAMNHARKLRVLFKAKESLKKFGIFSG